MINSIESERLQRLIDRKLETYERLKKEDPDNKALPYLNSEIMLLRDTIMPIVLSNTTIDYAEIRNFVTKSMRAVEKHPMARRFNDLLLHVHLKDAGIAKPILAFSSNLRPEDTIMTDFEINGLASHVVPVYFSTPSCYNVSENDIRIVLDFLRSKKEGIAQ